MFPFFLFLTFNYGLRFTFLQWFRVWGDTLLVGVTLIVFTLANKCCTRCFPDMLAEYKIRVTIGKYADIQTIRRDNHSTGTQNMLHSSI